MEKRDYYEVLTVERQADGTTLKSAYRRLAMECHPDRNPGDQQAEERFKELAEAYSVLSDPEKRKMYDAYGHAGPRQQGFSGFGGVEDILSQFADFFGGGFGGRGRRESGGGEQGEDLQTELRITFAEAAAGCKRNIEVNRQVRCGTCSGSGGKPGSNPTTCGTCGGRGQVAHNQGIFMIATTCPSCRGRGRIIKDRCNDCRGSGLQSQKDTVELTVPAGIDEGQTLRVAGRGQAGANGGPPGHLYVTFHIEPDARFERDGDNLVTEVRITFSQATLGGTVRVPTLGQPVELDVEAGTQPGTMRVLRGRGVPNVHGRGTGDLYVRLQVIVPKTLSADERRIIEELSALDPVAPADVEGDSSPEPAPGEEERGFFFRKKRKKR